MVVVCTFVTNKHNSIIVCIMLLHIRLLLLYMMYDVCYVLCFFVLVVLHFGIIIIIIIIICRACNAVNQQIKRESIFQIAFTTLLHYFNPMPILYAFILKYIGMHKVEPFSVTIIVSLFILHSVCFLFNRLFIHLFIYFIVHFNLFMVNQTLNDRNVILL